MIVILCEGFANCRRDFEPTQAANYFEEWVRLCSPEYACPMFETQAFRMNGARAIVMGDIAHAKFWRTLCIHLAYEDCFFSRKELAFVFDVVSQVPFVPCSTIR